MKRQIAIVFFWALLAGSIGNLPGSLIGHDGTNCFAPLDRVNEQSSQAITTHDVDPVVQYWSNFVAARQVTTHFAYTGVGDHENAGIYTAGGGAYLGVEAVHTVFKAGDFDLAVPIGTLGAQTLYAPTTRPPNGACLEVGTGYTTIPGRNTTVHVYAYDFCHSPKRFVKTIAVDDKFMQTYAGESVNGVPAYKIRIVQDGKFLTPQTKWSALIYDYVGQRWSEMAVSQGFIASDHNGWSIFETWYKKGQCSKTLKSLSATNISYYNVLSDSWEPMTDKMLNLSNTVHQGGNCFMDQDPKNLASYNLSRLQPEHGWKVIGTGN